MPPIGTRGIPRLTASSTEKCASHRHKPTLYIITPVIRDKNLTEMAENIRTLTEYFEVRWFPILDRGSYPVLGPKVLSDGKMSRTRGDGIQKRNLALDMIDRLDPGWIYFLDDDNLFHENFGPLLSQAISDRTHEVFFLRTMRINGTTAIIPKLARAGLDTGSYVVSTEAAKGVRWKLETRQPDFDWINDVCKKGYEPLLISQPSAYYNALRSGPRKKKKHKTMI